MTEIVERNPEVVANDKLVIKTSMPKTYKYIQQAAERLGDQAFKDVHLGLQGHPNHFIAYEDGLLMGTVFTQSGVMQDIIEQMHRFGVGFFCVVVEAKDGAH